MKAVSIEPPKRLVLLVVLAVTSFFAQAGDLRLWYRQPAANWNEALPVGNGRLGAMVHGVPFHETIHLNEESLWAGRPTQPETDVRDSLKLIQQLLLKGEIAQAAALSERSLKSNPIRFRSYQALGDIQLDYFYNPENKKTVEHYSRNLDLQTAISTTEFQYKGITHKREIFVSSAYDAIVLRVAVDQPGALTFRFTLNRKQDASVVSPDGNTIRMDGQVLDLPDDEAMTVGAHMRFCSVVKAINEGGSMESVNGSFLVKDATAVTFYITAATDYNPELMNFDRNINPYVRCASLLEMALSNSYEAIKQHHIQQHASLFNRVCFSLGDTTKTDIPTDQRLKAVQNGASDPALEALLFHYGRYLMISSSTAPGVLPANLQGIWSDFMIAPWNADFHVNINLQMNYWPVDVVQLHEAFTPFSQLINRLRKPGRITAQQVFNSQGWAMNHATDVFGRTAVTANVKYVFPMASSWLVLHLWEHYQFTRDRDYLISQAYPAMKEAAEFVLGFLVEDKNGYLVTAPSSSPENTYRLPTGEKFMLTYGSTMDIQICRELFESCLKAVAIADPSDRQFVARLRQSLAKLPPVEVSQRYGIVQEWIDDYEETEPGHRHVSQLFGLYPGTSINRSTPELYKAALNTLERREKYAREGQGFATGWSVAWMINFLARLEQPEKAHDKIEELMTQFMYPNMLAKHPPFQIDANFGLTSGVAEMLLQSHEGVIRLLPALPAAWSTGSVKGLKARGNITVDMEWKDGKVVRAKLSSPIAQTIKVHYGNKRLNYRISDSKSLFITQ